MIESLLLSKVLDTNEFYTLNKFNINEDDFATEKEIYLFIKRYVEEHKQTPDVRTIGLKFPHFEYTAELTDSFKYLCTELKNTTAKRKMFELLQSEASINFTKMDGLEFTKWLKKEIEQLEKMVDSSASLGTDYLKTGEERKESYLIKKENKEKIFVPTPYSTLNKVLNNGWLLGDYVLLLAFTNTGKTWLASHVGITAANADFNILHYSVELPKAQQLERLDTLNGHFNNSQLAKAELTNEEEYFEYLKKHNPKNETSYIIKSMEDLKNGLSTEQIEEDLSIYPQTQVVIIDGFNLMRHKGGVKNMRNSLSHTSRELRQLFVKHNVLGVVVHQTNASSEKEKKNKDMVEDVIPNPPSLLDYSETISTIQDSSCVLTFCQKKGIGRLSVEKARTKEGKGTLIDLHCDFDNGFIKQVEATDYF